MCLILFSWKQDTHHLLLAANRDEFYQRPSIEADFWETSPPILAGRDLKEGGTWIGVSTSGRFAAVTNYRAVDSTTYPKSRGHLTRDYLTGSLSPKEFALALEPTADQYAGFNLLIGDMHQLVYCSNRHPEQFWQPLEPGLYGLSNHLLDTPWPKVVKGKAVLERFIQSDSQPHDALFELLQDSTPAATEALPDTGVGLTLEKLLSPIFIASPGYGTRTSTLMKIDKGFNLVFEEKNYVAGQSKDEKHKKFSLKLG
jgi:uncharacterized protein with NRDE domain